MSLLDSFADRPLSSRTAILNMGVGLVGIVTSFVLALWFGVSLLLGILVTILLSALVAGGYFLANR